MQDFSYLREDVLLERGRRFGKKSTLKAKRALVIKNWD